MMLVSDYQHWLMVLDVCFVLIPIVLNESGKLTLYLVWMNLSRWYQLTDLYTRVVWVICRDNETVLSLGDC